MIETALDLARQVGVAPACQVLQLPRSSLYRARQGSCHQRGEPGRVSPSRPARALSPEQRAQVLDLLNSERFQDSSPRQVWARLLDEGTYLCSWRTMYRLLEQHDQVRERRNQLRHPNYQKPELLATSPKELWSWDITKLLGPAKWTYFYLYVILDVFSRYIVGYIVAREESALLARELIEQSCQNQGINPHELVLHSDRGPAMKSKTVALLLSELGVTKSHSRPHVSNDNPYSEAQFKTMKYRPEYPERFGCLEEARQWAREFVAWYNHEHCHSALGLMTPATVHYGQAERVRLDRQRVLEVAYGAHPERFVRGVPRAPEVPEAVWINKPEDKLLERSLLQ